MVVRGAPVTARDWLARSWLSIAFAIGFFVLWEALVKGFDVPRYIVPAPSAIFYQFFRNLPRIWEYTLVTGGETLAGFHTHVAEIRRIFFGYGAI